MSFETEQENKIRQSREAAAERSRESRESQENKEITEQEKAGMAMERADYLVKEVKSSNQQIKNIVLHMQQVMGAIKALRQQLQLTDSDDPASLVQDKQTIENLKKKIATHKDELIKMKDELIDAQVEQIKDGEGTTYTDQQLREKATEMVEEILALVNDDTEVTQR